MSKTPIRPFRLDVAVALSLQVAGQALFHTPLVMWICGSVGLLLTVARWQHYHSVRPTTVLAIFIKMQARSFFAGFLVAVAGLCWTPSSPEVQFVAGVIAALGVLILIRAIHSVSQEANQVWAITLPNA